MRDYSDYTTPIAMRNMLLGVVCALFSAGNCWAKARVITMASIHETSDKLSGARLERQKALARRVSAETDATLLLDYKSYTTGALIREPEGRLGMLERGEVALAELPVHIAVPIEPGLSLFALPYVVRDGKHLQQIVSAAPGSILARRLLAKRGLRLLGFALISQRIVASRKPLLKASDLNGLRVSVMATPSVSNFEAWGAKPISPKMNVSELAARGAIDAVETTYARYQSSGLARLFPAVNELDHVYRVTMFLASEKALRSLSSAQQGALILAVKQHIQAINQSTEDSVRNNRSRAKAAGATVTLLPAQERAKLAKASESLIRTREAAIGKDLIDSLRAVPAR